MAVTSTQAKQWSDGPISFSGLSSDSKPTTYEAPGNTNQAVPEHSVFYETDTGDGYLYIGGTWYQHLESGKPISVLHGVDESGTTREMPVTAEGHLEVALHAPRLPFGSVHTEKLTPIMQADGVYGIQNYNSIVTTNAGGSVTAANNMIQAATGTNSGAYGTYQSKARLRYRPGQGVVGRFTALFSSPVANGVMVAGFGTAESTLAFGYNGTSFGILHSTDGVREIQTLTVTTASGTAENITITLDGTAFNDVPVTNASGDISLTAYEIASYNYTGWSAEQTGDTVVFIANTVGDKTGSFTLSGASTAVGTFAKTTTGVATTDTWISQSSWNGDKLDGTGPSGATLDQTKGNVFQIGIQYLGFGGITFDVEVAGTGNNPTFVNAHTILAPNSRTTPTLSQPSFPFLLSAYSAGSTTDISAKFASYAGFVEGEKKYLGPKLSYSATSTSVTTSNYYCLFTIRNNSYFKGRANQIVSNIVSFGAGHDDATPVEIFLLKNATLAGAPDFQEHTADSPVFIDTAATTATISDNNQIVYELPLGQASGQVLNLSSEELNLQPGETLTVAARTVTGTATYVLASVNTREDQ